MSEQVAGIVKYIGALLVLMLVVTAATYFVIRMPVNTADLAFDAPVKQRSQAETDQVEAMRATLRKADSRFRGGMSESEGFGASAPAVQPEPLNFSE